METSAEAPAGAGTDEVPAGATAGAGTEAGSAGRSRARWCLGTRLLVAGTAAWAVFVAAHVLLTGRWWFWLVVESMPPVTLVVVPLLLLAVTPLARPVRRRLSVVLLALLLLGAQLAGVSPLGLAQGDGPPGGALKVFSWSTDVWEMSDDPVRFYDYLRAQRADVYLLQEYLHWGDGPLRVDDLARVRAAFPGYHIATEGELITISRLPIVATYPRRTSPTGTDWYWRGNKALRVDVRSGTRVLSLYNVHLPVPIRTERSPLTAGFYEFVRDQYQRRRGEFAALRADLARNPNPAVVAGDFNSAWMNLIPPGEGLRRLDPEGSALPLTWPTSAFAIPLPRLWRLDWVFTTEEVRVPRYRLVPSISDHLAQELYVSLN
ncbi:endonuclease/exonuclease/phosphatase family protein [Streptosporangium sp. NPDC002524]|uniref:endonuclease/exonuclease/phosphatase family protein n=1 Tax=Streptosporangium sp. NPDC002524 TaxID=3154537 RepID=UPI0033173D20